MCSGTQPGCRWKAGRLAAFLAKKDGFDGFVGFVKKTKFYVLLMGRRTQIQQLQQLLHEAVRRACAKDQYRRGLQLSQ